MTSDQTQVPQQPSSVWEAAGNSRTWGLGLTARPRGSGSGQMGQCTCQVEVGDGALGPDGGHHTRMQTVQVMVSPVAGTPGSSQIELTGQWGSSSHTVHLRGKKAATGG